MALDLQSKAHLVNLTPQFELLEKRESQDVWVKKAFQDITAGSMYEIN